MAFENMLHQAVTMLQCQGRGEAFAGVIYAHQLQVIVGQSIQDLEVIAPAVEPEDFTNQVSLRVF